MVIVFLVTFCVTVASSILYFWICEFLVYKKKMKKYDTMHLTRLLLLIKKKYWTFPHSKWVRVHSRGRGYEINTHFDSLFWDILIHFLTLFINDRVCFIVLFYSEFPLQYTVHVTNKCQSWSFQVPRVVCSFSLSSLNCLLILLPHSLCKLIYWMIINTLEMYCLFQ